MVSARFVLAGGLSLCSVAQADVSYQGEARDLDTGTLLYREHHLVRQDGALPRERVVLYRCVDDALFARKRVDYSNASASPAFAMEDGRFGYREGVRLTDASLITYVRRDAASDEEQTALASTKRLVIDAGFDEFVRAHWNELQRGDTLTLDFLVPSRLDSYGFKLRKVESVPSDDAQISVFRLSLGGVLGWFADDIEVRYRDADRRLMRFEGLTNIRADRKDNLHARIDFPPQLERSGLGPAEWEQALAEPLTACEPGG